MKISIIGSGNVGGALARRFRDAGYAVIVGARLPLSEKSQKLAFLIGFDSFASIENAVKETEVIVITTPPEVINSLIAQMGSLDDKIIIDATNSIRTKPESFPTVFHAIRNLSANTKVVKCFNTTGFENLLNPKYGAIALDMFMAGNDKKAKEIASELALAIGFGNCYDFGGEDKVELLEQLALCWINLAIFQRQGRDIGFVLLFRNQ